MEIDVDVIFSIRGKFYSKTNNLFLIITNQQRNDNAGFASDRASYKISFDKKEKSR